MRRRPYTRGMYSRRDLVRALGFIPALQAQPDFLARINHRLLGRTGRWVTPLGLGGQASLQWTNRGIDPADIIVRAIELGINYLDSANAYGPSQANYQTAIWRLHLSPADSEYDAAARERLYFATKTGQRYAAAAIGELRQSLTVMFGDGRGWVPDGAYLDAMQMHAVGADSQVDQIFRAVVKRGAATAEQDDDARVRDDEADVLAFPRPTGQRRRGHVDGEQRQQAVKPPASVNDLPGHAGVVVRFEERARGHPHRQ